MIAKILISNSPDQIKEEIEKAVLLHLGGTTRNHPDVLYFTADSKLGVGEAKEIREFFSIKPYSAKGRAVVLEDAGNLTPEAQNALLKTLEEPPEEAILLLGAAATDNFLPTILSRCEIITLDKNGHPELVSGSNGEMLKKFQHDIELLLTQEIGERFEYIEKLKDQKKKEEFLQALTAYFHQALPSHTLSGNVDFLKELLQAEEWAKSNVNLRGILEYLMLVISAKKV